MRVMPQFSRPQRGYSHTIDSVLQALDDLGIARDRITITMAGRGWPDRTIVGQAPRAGVELTSDVSISLLAAGTGAFHALPTGMWDRGAPAEPGTAEIVGLFDDPIQKAARWIRDGARLFDVGPDNLAACSRWISLFGLVPEDWPTDSLYNLAILLPSLHRLAGKLEGIKLALDVLLSLPLKSIHRQTNYCYLPPTEQSRLAEHRGRLGIDLVAGDRREGLARWIVTIGPVPLSTYYRFQEPDQQRLLDAVLALTLPMYQAYSVVWTVLDREAPIFLGVAEKNGVLGVNSYFGSSRMAVSTGAPNG